MKPFIIIPAYNEAKTIRKVIEACREYSDRIVVVDDASSDATARIAQETGAVVLRHPINIGKGGALTTGTEYAIEHGAEAVVFIDADLQHSPDEIPAMVEKLRDADIVFGYRSLDRNMPFLFRFGNTCIQLIAYLLFGKRIRDVTCGYKAFRASSYPKIHWESPGYSVESEIVANTIKNRVRFVQHRIPTRYLDAKKGTNVIDGLLIGKDMVLFRFMRRNQ